MIFYKTIFRILLTVFMTFIFCYSPAQPPKKRVTREEYIAKYKNDAIRDMNKTGVPASITLAQGMLESENGNSDLAILAKNHFGIKCHLEWNGDTYVKDDDHKNECFRKYNTVLESFDDHSAFLKSRKHYASLFDLPRTDYKAWANGLKKAGYATNPNYGPMIIKLIEDNKLYEFDTEANIPVAVQKQPEQPKHEVKQNEYNFPAKILLSSNKVKYVLAEDGDNCLKIAKRYDMSLWQIYKYNDIDKNILLKKGQRIYLKPKRRKSAEDLHVVKAGETMHSISQLHGIKLKFLYRKNRMETGSEPKAGQKLSLKKKIKNTK
jgi:LysM repeat protein